MRFWDSSALVPLLIEEPGTALATQWLRRDPEVAVWGLTRLELSAAIERRTRQGRVSAPLRRTALDRLERLTASAREVVDLLAVRQLAVRLLSRHPLRAADAAQLAAALLVAEDDPSSLAMACFDRPLAEAAEREGLRVLTWPE